MPRQLLPLILTVSVTAFVEGACSTSGPDVMPTAPASGAPATPAPTSNSRITSDADLFALVTRTEPFDRYALFPSLNVGADGTLAASSAHQPVIRVRLNGTAAATLQNSRLPAGTRFSDGAVILKEVLTSSGETSVYAVMYKDGP